jgi:Fe2+ transport system protein FeoA
VKAGYIPSNKIPKGKSGIIREIKGEITFVARLREMGFGEGMTVTRFNEGKDRCIIVNVNVKNTKIWLTEYAAECIFVELV